MIASPGDTSFIKTVLRKRNAYPARPLSRVYGGIRTFFILLVLVWLINFRDI